MPFLDSGFFTRSQLCSLSGIPLPLISSGAGFSPCGIAVGQWDVCQGSLGHHGCFTGVSHAPSFERTVHRGDPRMVVFHVLVEMYRLRRHR